MIIIASYTANLAAFLTVETLDRPIESAYDLEKQSVIKYGAVNGGSTAGFFQKSLDPIYKRMGDVMRGRLFVNAQKLYSNVEGLCTL